MCCCCSSMYVRVRKIMMVDMPSDQPSLDTYYPTTRQVGTQSKGSNTPTQNTKICRYVRTNFIDVPCCPRNSIVLDT